MKKLIALTTLAACLFSLSTTTQARGSNPGDFRYYHFQCLDSNQVQLWFRISQTYNPTFATSCENDGGRLKVTKVFW
ncbi:MULTISPECIES: hypothetical protein [Pseudoalteromonas]|uniref:Uncharacterized protein n=1 Tax=Pseudoalteromonas rubra TaxID=43658 RepID=A0A0L0ER81_9GAMM|nr:MULTISPECIES: hypothetical protein [Pseudoalteromonas]ALU42318.1 hypothetical protein AT705_04780 [Pseudoalteromonas rubra]KNC66997.1 hypothetical protein AC626_13535 [Pseudoalteromonas rubra]MDK1311251.1 hypothetical protein [Pseudoalteromonas sp. R96]